MQKGFQPHNSVMSVSQIKKIINSASEDTTKD